MKKEDKKELARILDEVLSKKDSKFMCRIIYDLENNEPTIDVRDNQPTIIKSGDTWVAEYDGVDYLCFDNDFGNKKSSTGSIREDFIKDVANGIWKPISEIEITDEIARLRPMIIIIDKDGDRINEKARLFMVDKLGVFYSAGWFRKGHHTSMRLATVKDLKNV